MQKKKIGAGKIGCIVVVVVFLVMVIGIYRLFNDRKALPEDFVLKINLSGDIAETTGTGFELPFQSGSNELSLQDIMFLLERAGEDNRVRSVLLDIGGLQTASAKIQQLQLAIEPVSYTHLRAHET